MSPEPGAPLGVWTPRPASVLPLPQPSPHPELPARGGYGSCVACLLGFVPSWCHDGWVPLDLWGGLSNIQTACSSSGRGRAGLQGGLLESPLHVCYLFLAELGLCCCVGFSLPAVRGDHLQLRCTGVSGWWLLLGWSRGLGAPGLQ